MEVTRTFTFDAAHRLSDYEGKCKNIHGHTYKVKITVSGELNDLGMIMDFGKLKELYQELVEDRFDHHLILKRKDELNENIGKVFPKGDKTITWVPYNPTAENMAMDIYDRFDIYFLKHPLVRIEKVIVYETPTSYAEFGRE